jgi:hypothetical protein
LGHEFETIEDLIGALRAENVREVTLAAKVATTTTPGGDQISFRGRIVIEAALPSGERAEYVEQIMPYITTTKSPGLDPTADKARDLRQAQLFLARQLRSYRGEYQGVVSAARAEVTEKLRQAGIVVVEPSD